MCGIFGLALSENSQLSQSELEKSLEELFRLSAMRGKESSGVVIRDFSQSRLGLFKAPVPATKLSSQSGFQNLKEHFLGNGHGPTHLALLGHARLVTNGAGSDNHNNQPIVRDGMSVVHNGIVVNVDELWEQHPQLEREYTVDTELLAALIQFHLEESHSLEEATRKAFAKIYGAASIAFSVENNRKLVLATNNGSLYWCCNSKRGHLYFASERLILSRLLEVVPNLASDVDSAEIRQLVPGRSVVIDCDSLSWHEFSLFDLNGKSSSNGHSQSLKSEQLSSFQDFSLYDPNARLVPEPGTELFEEEREQLIFPKDQIAELKRCTRCILPETFPFISFDEEGCCNFCKNYKPLRCDGPEKLEEFLAPYRSKDGSPDCLVTFSGGRDSSYGLHLIREKYGMTPIAYTYDWGMVTDLARRNQSRLTAKLGVEHILVSADIDRKRSNIRKNVSAWLAKPNLGTIPLFMAGDKQYFYYANQLGKANNLKLVVLCENLLETTNFKAGFCGLAPNFGAEHTYSLGILQKIKMLSFYGQEFIRNPRYLNSSMLDTIGAFLSYYFIEHNYLNMFNYERWEEPVVESLLKDEYDWEISEDTPSTWRIGDGTAAFYNYIYYTVSGFSEFDTFRSNQIREGMITREQALEFIEKENAPRYESIRWYLDTIGLEFKPTIAKINSIPKLYQR